MHYGQGIVRRRLIVPQAEGFFSSSAGSSGGPTTTAQLIALFGANLVGIWDADISGSLSLSGSNVLTWTDQGPNGYVLGLNTLTGESAPTSPVFGSSSYGGLAGLTFTAASKMYLATGVADVSLGVTTTSWFASAFATSSWLANARLLSSIANGQSADFNTTNSAIVIGRNAGTTALYAFHLGAIGSYSITLNTPSRFGVVFDGANATTYLNNISQASGAATFTFGATGRIGLGDGSGSSGAVWDGVVRRFIATKTAVSSSDRASIDSWLQN